MTKRKEALEALLAKVEAGEIHDTGSDRFSAVNNGVGVYIDHQAATARDAYFGSLDAAKALHEALLPPPEEMAVHLTNDIRPPVWRCEFYTDDSTVALSSDPDPARAWLIAIIKALIAQEEA